MKPKTAGRTTGSCHDANPIRAVNVAAFDAAGTTTCGITPDAKIVTMDGLRQLQDLRVGDRLVTRNQGAVPVKSIEQHSIVTRAVYIIAGSLGHSQPDRDTLLPAGQTIHVRDWRAQILGQSDSILAAAGVWWTESSCATSALCHSRFIELDVTAPRSSTRTGWSWGSKARPGPLCHWPQPPTQAEPLTLRAICRPSLLR